MAEDHCNPGIIDLVLKAAKGFTERELSSDIESGKIEPFHNVNDVLIPTFTYFFGRGLSFLSQSADQETDIFLKQPLAVPQRMC